MARQLMQETEEDDDDDDESKSVDRDDRDQASGSKFEKDNAGANSPMDTESSQVWDQDVFHEKELIPHHHSVQMS